MDREYSHFESKEPIFEKILRELRFRKIFKYIPDDSRLLDLGCGYGAELLNRTKNKLSVGVGLDISVNSGASDEKIILIKHDLSDPLPFENDAFDIVASLANLEHLCDPANAMREIHRVLKPEGSLLLTAPSTFSKPVLEFLSFRLGLISEREIRDHKQYADRKTLVGYCEKIGFSSWKHKYFQLGMNNFLIARK